MGRDTRMTTNTVRPIAQFCYKCNSDKIIRAKRRISNGVFQVLDYCRSCGCNANRTNLIPHAEAGDLSRLPMLDDYTIGMPPCERCGSSEGVEDHHWAPQHIFQDAHTWPRSYLCISCHNEWHETINSHYYECNVCKRMYEHEAEFSF